MIFITIRPYYTPSGPGKAANELKRLVESSDLYCTVTTTTTADAAVIFKAKSGTNADRNIVIRSAVNEILTKSLVIPVQELKREQSLHSTAAKAKFDPTVSKESRQNPDTSAGQYVSGAILQKAAYVQMLREKAKAEKEQSAINAEAARVKQREAKRITYNAFVDTYGGQGMDAMRKAFKNISKPTLMAVYQHLGYRPCDLSDAKKATLEEFLVNDDKFCSIVDMPSLPKVPLSTPAPEASKVPSAPAVHVHVSKVPSARVVSKVPSAAKPHIICNISPLSSGGGATYNDWWDAIQEVECCGVGVVVLEYDGRPRHPSVISNLEFFQSLGTVVDVPPYGNCAYDALGLGLCYQGKCSMTGGTCSDLRSILREHAEANRDRLLALPCYPSLELDPEGWWKENVVDRIFKPGVDYTTDAKYEEWFDAAYVAPIVADNFGTKIVLYDAQAGETTTFAPGRNGKVSHTHVRELVLVPPPSGAIVAVFESNHYYWVMI